MNAKERKIAMAGGIMWAALMFVCTLGSVYFGYSTEFLKVMASIYPGYSITVIGSVIGAVYGFFDVYIGMYIFFWIYRRVK